jgi:hypothetical protein
MSMALWTGDLAGHQTRISECVPPTPPLVRFSAT